MHDTFTIVLLAILTALSGVASVIAIYRLSQPDRSQALRLWVTCLLSAVTFVSGVLFVYLWIVVRKQWQPLTAHVDGLVLIATLFGATTLFIQTRKRLSGLTAFALPILTVLLAWSVCSAKWTYRPFDISTLHPVWVAVHLVGVYLGTLIVGVAAVAGGMFLFVQYRLKHKSDLQNLGKFASLETLENLIVRTSTLGFALLTLGLVSGAVLILSEREQTVPQWYWVKIAISTCAWALYALLMNVRYTATFRGSRAAWLSIVGLVMLLAVYGVVNALPQGGGG